MATGKKFPADKARSYASIERDAKRLRALLGIKPTERIDHLIVLSELRRLRPSAERRYPFDYHVEMLDSGVLAKTHFLLEHPRDESRGPLVEVVLSESTMEGLDAGDGRALFSLAHEVAHYFLHSNELVRLASMSQGTAALLRRANEQIPAYQDAEWQANAFAGAFLMPASLLQSLESEDRLNAREVSELTGASLEGAGVRLQVFQDKRGCLCQKPS